MFPTIFIIFLIMVSIISCEMLQFQPMKILPLLLSFLLISACTPSSMQPNASPAQVASPTALPATGTPLPTASFTITRTATLTRTPTITQTPTITATPTQTLTPTFNFPKVVVTVTAAHCRYGPHQAYLHAADLYQGDRGEVRGRWYLNGWLRVLFDKLNYQCWVAPSVVEVTGDLNTVIVMNQIDLTRIGTNQYGPPQGLRATRDGDQVTIRWDQMSMTDDKDRGYFIDMFVCQNGAYLWWPVSFPDQYTTSYTVTDEPGCPSPSGGVIYTVEKHGYSQPETIPWP